MLNCDGVTRVVARARAPLAMLLLIAGGFTLLRRDFLTPSAAPGASQAVSIQAAFGRLPLEFELNQGQTDSRVNYLARGLGYGLYLTNDQAVLVFPFAEQKKQSGSVLDMRFVGASHRAKIGGVDRLPGRSNYFIGNDASHWRTNIPQFSRVQYREIYDGVDLEFYGKQGRLEYDFDVAPGADYRQIQLDFRGAQKLSIAENGDLVIALGGRELRFEAPIAYQNASSNRTPVKANFVERADGRVGFEVAAYDRTRALVIDPVLTFSTYFGGAGNESCTAILKPAAGFVPHCPSLVVDSAQRVYIAGATDNATGFPAATAGSPGSFGPGGASDVFVARLSASGTQLDFVTFLGGTGINYPTGLGVDSGFNLHLAGTTTAPDFPTTPNAFQASATGTHVFVAKLDSTGSVPLYISYLAGSGTDMTSGLAVDSQGLDYVFGTTTSTTSPLFPTTPGSLQPSPGTGATSQFFFSKVNPTLSGQASLQYSTFLGGSTPVNATVTGGAIAVDSATPPNVYLAGGTSFTDMPVLNAFAGTAPTKTGGATLSVWAAKLNGPATNTQQYTPSFETYFGGGGDVVAYGVATDGTNTYITGSTTSSDITIPTSTSAFQSTIGGGTDGFVAKFGLPLTTGTTQGSVPLSYFTYLGGSGSDTGLAIISDPGTSSGNVRVTGFTDSSNFPVTPENLQAFGGARDAFVARILTVTTTSSTNTSSATFLGGSGVDIGTGIAEDSALDVYVAGETSSGNFPIPAGTTPVQSSLKGGSDAFVAKLGPNINGLLSFTCNSSIPVSGPGCPSPAPTNPNVNPTPVGVGNDITFTYSIYNQGDPVTGAVFTDTIQGTSTIKSATANPGTCAVGASTTAVCNLGTINTSTTTTTTSGTTQTATTASAATVTVVVTAPVPTPSSPPQQPAPVGNSGILSVPGTNFVPVQSQAGSATVNDFGVTATPSGANGGTVTAGAVAQYQVTVTPTGPFPEAVTLSCAAPLPTGAGCSFSSSSIPNLNNGPQGRVLEITTTARVITPASLFRRGGVAYALWLPLSGLALIGGGISRKRRVRLLLGFIVVLGAVTLQSACSSSKSTTTTSTGTPAGTYNVTVQAVSGSATRTTVVQLVVK